MGSIEFRGVERVLIVLIAGVFGYLGYKLYLHGIDNTKGKIQFKRELTTVLIGGVGPGVFFMLFGAGVLVSAIKWGGASTTTYRESVDPKAREEVAAIQERLKTYEQTNMQARTPADFAEVKKRLDHLQGQIDATTKVYREVTTQVSAVVAPKDPGRVIYMEPKQVPKPVPAPTMEPVPIVIEKN